MENEEPTPSECGHDSVHVMEWDDMVVIDFTFKDGTPGEQRVVPMACQECGKKAFWIGVCDKQNKYRRSIAFYVTAQEYNSMILGGTMVFKKLLGYSGGLEPHGA